MLKKVFLFCFLGIFFQLQATHNRAGYISYTYMGSGMYEFRIFTYTNLASVGADRCDLTIYIDNADSIVCQRYNGFPNPCPNGGNGYDGVTIVPTATVGTYGGVKANIYRGQYVLNYGMHVFTMIDPNRDFGIINLGGQNSGNLQFALIDTVYLYPFVPGAHFNSTPIISNPPIQNACAGQDWCYNPGAIDPENDSLDFSIVNSFSGDSSNPPGGVVQFNAGSETIPSNMSVDRYTGNLCWTPVANITGEYDVSLLIKEFRRTPNGGPRILVGETIFDIQIYVIICQPSNIVFTQSAQNVCLIAGQNFSTSITATGSGGGFLAPLHLNATGLALTSTVIGQDAVFTTSSSSPFNTVNGVLSWTPSCNAISYNTYYITYQAFDSNTPLANANFFSSTIKVIAPPPSNVTATPIANNAVLVAWGPPTLCGTMSVNPIIDYFVYRVDGCPATPPDSCQTGAPPSIPYVLIGIVPPTTNPLAFTDNNSGMGLSPGSQYSYIVVAQFADGSLSIASANACVIIKLNLPLMMITSVDTTDATSGVNSLAWKNPFAGMSFLDTVVNPGPYKYILYRKATSAPAVNYLPIKTVNANSYYQLKNLADTTFTDLQLDTRDTQYNYKVDFYDSPAGISTYLGSTPSSNSIFVSAIPHDRKVILSWSAPEPWLNYKFYIWRQNYANSGYTLIDSTIHSTDTVKNLVNKFNYCFKVEGYGRYSSPLVKSPLINFSQKICSTPIDDSPPCQPQLTIAGDCGEGNNLLIWRDPNHTCGINDVVAYLIYYTPYQDSTLHRIDSISNPLDTTFTTDIANSIAGCYVVVAIDSVGNKSPLTNESCVDNCPEYELPNIFTPNGDNINDQFIPVKNKYIKDVKFEMYNRWGEMVFSSSQPGLGWDGKIKEFGSVKPASDGTYFYICQVDELHYYGIKSRTLKGFVQLIH